MLGIEAVRDIPEDGCASETEATDGRNAKESVTVPNDSIPTNADAIKILVAAGAVALSKIGKPADSDAKFDEQLQDVLAMLEDARGTNILLELANSYAVNSSLPQSALQESSDKVLDEVFSRSEQSTTTSTQRGSDMASSSDAQQTTSRSQSPKDCDVARSQSFGVSDALIVDYNGIAYEFRFQDPPDYELIDEITASLNGHGLSGAVAYYVSTNKQRGTLTRETLDDFLRSAEVDDQCTFQLRLSLHDVRYFQKQEESHMSEVPTGKSISESQSAEFGPDLSNYSFHSAGDRSLNSSAPGNYRMVYAATDVTYCASQGSSPSVYPFLSGSQTPSGVPSDRVLSDRPRFHNVQDLETEGRSVSIVSSRTVGGNANFCLPPLMPIDECKTFWKTVLHLFAGCANGE